MNETLTTIVGNIVGAVNRRQLADGTVVASFRVASNTRRWDRESGTWCDGARFFVSVSCWRRLGENVARSFDAGDPVIVYGRLSTRDFERDGARSWVTEMEGLAVGPDLGRSTAVVTRMPRPVAPGSVPAAGGRGESVSSGSGALARPAGEVPAQSQAWATEAGVPA